MSEPTAVLVSDVHYSLPTLELADKAMRMAINKANELQIPLIVAGDLHDTKANLRGECVLAMLETFKTLTVPCFVIVGNHDLINEKAANNSIEFLDGLNNESIRLVRKAHISLNNKYPALIAYHSQPSELRKVLSTIPKGSTLIMHQGLTGSNSGEYIQDHSAIIHNDVTDFRVISGHYHTRQDIKTGRARKGAVGLWSYIGNPYSLTFGEAYDPPKGFQILMDDGTLEFIPTNLRRHVIVKHNLKTGENEQSTIQIQDSDLVWVKVSGTKEQLSRIEKSSWLEDKGLPQNARFDLIPLDNETRHSKKTEGMKQSDILDDCIDNNNSLSQDAKERLKALWKNL